MRLITLCIQCFGPSDIQIFPEGPRAKSEIAPSFNGSRAAAAFGMGKLMLRSPHRLAVLAVEVPSTRKDVGVVVSNIAARANGTSRGTRTGGMTSKAQATGKKTSAATPHRNNRPCMFPQTRRHSRKNPGTVTPPVNRQHAHHRTNAIIGNKNSAANHPNGRSSPALLSNRAPAEWPDSFARFGSR